MKYVSLFSGLEAAHLAWRGLGWECAAVAEVEPAPCSVLAHRLGATRPRYDAPFIDPKAYRSIRFGSKIPNLGDVSQVTDADIEALGPVDLLIGGSPCQDLSIAGKRAGLAGSRSSLFHQQIRIFHATRHLCGARYLLWENVPGALSSNEGRDFAVVVGAMAGIELAVPEDGWGTEGMAVGPNGLVEWCVLDAQWFGVAQRRRRLFALLDTGDWSGRSPVLLERDSVRGDSPPRREKGSRAAEGPDGGSGERDWPAKVSCTLNTHFGDKQGLEDQHALNGAPLFVPDVVGPVLKTLTTRTGNSMGPRDIEDGAVVPMVSHSVSSKWAKGSGGFAGSTEHHNLTVKEKAVRRLTPLECERLQGIEDNWTLVPKSTRTTSDGVRYKMIGNSFAVPVIRWIGEQIERTEKEGRA